MDRKKDEIHISCIHILNRQDGHVFVLSNQGPMQWWWNICPHRSFSPFLSSAFSILSLSSWQMEHSGTSSIFYIRFIYAAEAAVRLLWPNKELIKLSIPPPGASKVCWIWLKVLIKLFAFIGGKAILWTVYPGAKCRACTKLNGNILFMGGGDKLFACCACWGWLGGLGIWYIWNDDGSVLTLDVLTASKAVFEQKGQVRASSLLVNFFSQMKHQY
jgi:hypothetical protein